jgi:hypothetical protein
MGEGGGPSDPLRHPVISDLARKSLIARAFQPAATRPRRR